jgi:hypothetical protein
MEYVAGGNMADYILKSILLKFGQFDRRDGLVMDEDEALYFFKQVGGGGWAGLVCVGGGTGWVGGSWRVQGAGSLGEGGAIGRCACLATVAMGRTRVCET